MDISDRIHCEVCGATFTLRKNYLRHFRAKHENDLFACTICNASFNRKDILKRHLKTHDKRKALLPEVSSSSREDRSAKKPRVVRNNGNVLLESAFQSRLKTLRLENPEGILDIRDFLESKREEFYDIIKSELLTNQLKVNCFFVCIYEKASDAGVIAEEKDFKTRNTIVLESTDLEEFYTAIVNKLLAESEEFESSGSGWTLSEILYLEIRINKFNPLRASMHLDLPQVIKDKHAVVNVNNVDNKCFEWAIISAIHPSSINSTRTSCYEQFLGELNFTGIDFPVKLTDIRKFEKNNSNISVNVYGLDEKNKLYPLYISDSEKQQHVDLLYLSEKGNNHYAWIKDLSRLTSSQLSKHHGKTFICRRCLQHFSAEEILLRHKIDCNMHDAVRVLMPSEKDKWIHFKNFRYIHKIPFVIYADFECLIKTLDSCAPNSSRAYTEYYQKHEAISFCYYISYFGNVYKPPIVYRGLDAVKVFMQMLKEEAKAIESIYRHPLPMLPLTDEELESFRTAESCYMCNCHFTASNYKVCKILYYSFLVDIFMFLFYFTCLHFYFIINFIISNHGRFQ